MQNQKDSSMMLSNCFSRILTLASAKLAFVSAVAVWGLSFSNGDANNETIAVENLSFWTITDDETMIAKAISETNSTTKIEISKLNGTQLPGMKLKLSDKVRSLTWSLDKKHLAVCGMNKIYILRICPEERKITSRSFSNQFLNCCFVGKNAIIGIGIKLDNSIYFSTIRFSDAGTTNTLVFPGRISNVNRNTPFISDYNSRVYIVGTDYSFLDNKFTKESTIIGSNQFFDLCTVNRADHLVITAIQEAEMKGPYAVLVVSKTILQKQKIGMPNITNIDFRPRGEIKWMEVTRKGSLWIQYASKSTTALIEKHGQGR